jgi:hypothetical protein
MANRTGVQIKCPHIVQILPVVPTTEDEELGTDHRRGRVKTTDGTGTIDHDAGPHSRFWSAVNSNQLGSVLTSKDPTCRGEADKV